MSFFDDAQAFMASRSEKIPKEKKDYPRDEYIEKLRAEFENATRVEIERALDRLSDKGDMPDNFSELLKKIRVYLED